MLDVSYKTKIQKFKQITTTTRNLLNNKKMFPIKQRYKNLSKSQHSMHLVRPNIDVSYKTKIQKFKQITTCHWDNCWSKLMFPIKQRYKNLSKSQH